ERSGLLTRIAATVNASFGPCLCSRPALFSRVRSTPFPLFTRVIRRASIQPCEFGDGHAFQSYPQIFVLLSFFSDNRGAKFLKIFQKAETLPRFWNLRRRFKITANWLAKLARNTCQHRS